MLYEVFPSPIYYHQATADETARIKESCISHKDIKSRCDNVKHPDYAIPRTTDQFNCDDCITEAGMDYIDQYVEHHVRKFEELLGDSNSLVPTTRAKAWFNWCGKGQGQHWHSHSEARISGTIYITCPDGAIEFRTPNPFTRAGMSPQHGQFDTLIQRNPSPGDVILFPGWMEHRVIENTSEYPRISISFDYYTDLGKRIHVGEKK